MIEAPEAAQGGRRAAGWVARGSFGLIGVWIAATMLASRAGWTRLWVVLDLPFHFVCHRVPERVLSVLGTPMPLCSRCAGIWMGLSVAASLAWPDIPVRTLRIVVPVAAALLLLDVVTQDLGLHPVWHATRLATGLLLSVPMGGAIGATIARELQGRRDKLVAP